MKLNKSDMNIQDLSKAFIYSEQQVPQGAILAAHKGQSQQLQQDIDVVVQMTCHSCGTFHDFPFLQLHLHSAFLPISLGGHKG